MAAERAQASLRLCCHALALLRLLQAAGLCCLYRVEHRRDSARVAESRQSSLLTHDENDGIDQLEIVKDEGPEAPRFSRLPRAVAAATFGRPAASAPELPSCLPCWSSCGSAGNFGLRILGTFIFSFGGEQENASPRGSLPAAPLLGDRIFVRNEPGAGAGK